MQRPQDGQTSQGKLPFTPGSHGLGRPFPFPTRQEPSTPTPGPAMGPELSWTWDPCLGESAPLQFPPAPQRLCALKVWGADLTVAQRAPRLEQKTPNCTEGRHPAAPCSGPREEQYKLPRKPGPDTPMADPKGPTSASTWPSRGCGSLLGREPAEGRFLCNRLSNKLVLECTQHLRSAAPAPPRSRVATPGGPHNPLPNTDTR